MCSPTWIAAFAGPASHSQQQLDSAPSTFQSINPALTHLASFNFGIFCSLPQPHHRRPGSLIDGFAAPLLLVSARSEPVAAPQNLDRAIGRPSVPSVLCLCRHSSPSPLPFSARPLASNWGPSSSQRSLAEPRRRSANFPATPSPNRPQNRLMISRITQVARHFAAAPTSISSAPILSSRSRPHLGGIAAMASAAERQRRTIQTAACLIIGDEVLGGKTNSAYLAKWCFQIGLRLKKIEVVEDDEADIIDAIRRLSNNYDFVVTRQVTRSHSSHQIGSNLSSHDDITYQSIAKAFDLPLKLHDEAFKKMKLLSKPHPSQPNFNWDVDSPDLRAKLRMVYLPTDESRPLTDQFLFASEELWVPVSVVNGNVHILPGIPRLFTALLEGIKPHILSRLVDPEGKGSHRVVIQTPFAESKVAAYLTDLAGRVEPKGIKVGSYPHWDRKFNTVTLVGKDQAFLESLVDEVVKNVDGKRVFKPEDLEGGPLRESKA
ncbi:molybdopterin binding domain containing protein [Cordyceps militaris CM01]|uniref:Molybdopterin binding domain containing protein n=1 Tax=Cordyceps militaris (strain CM01) TaxID=983644 RepID=G3JLK1_CORMM|nr:molybdopterin binding domain containing protein [Cordyceps militaris CM01]EGX90575.1 molybdopterin binding domain containing protein [Cordyceps militaris CM01]